VATARVSDEDPSSRGRSQVRCLWALDYATGQIIWQLSLQKDGTAFVAFLDHLVATLPDGPLVIVLDNVGYPKGRLAKNW
jgi:hypothetical protein